MERDGHTHGSLIEVNAGFIPLLDCAPLVIAHQKGFARDEGLDLRLHREVSWANIRDRIDLGHLDCAHMLAPMPLAATLGLARMTEPVIAPMSLSLNGNAITVSNGLYGEMMEAKPDAARNGGRGAATAVADVVRKRQAEGKEPLTFGMVYPFSSHNYDLRAWLASAGVDPDGDINLIVVPPPLITENLRQGRIDGFCVGAPWNSLAVAEGLGVIVTTKSELWPMSPEKVLGVREAWAESNGATLAALVRALVRACCWLDEASNHQEAAAILARAEYIGVAASVISEPLSGQMRLGRGRVSAVPDMVVFNRGDANYPWRSHAVWFLTQMIRWGQVRTPFDLAAVARRVYRPDLYRSAVGPLAIGVPAGDVRPESSLVAIDDVAFDPMHPLQSLERTSIRSRAVDLSLFAAANP